MQKAGFTGIALIAGFTAVVGGGCAEPPGGARGPHAVSDSAGVQIVRNAAQGVPSLDLVEDLRIGQLDGPTLLQFHQIGAITVDVHDSLFVADNGSGQVRVFSPGGEPVRAFGRRGRGPGEFVRVSGLLLRDEGLLVVDAGLMRATLVDRSGAVQETSALLTPGGVLEPAGSAGDEWIVSLREMPDFAPSGEATRSTVKLLRRPLFGAPAQQATAVGSAEAAPVLLEYVEGRSYTFASAVGSWRERPLWEPQPQHAVDGAGRIYLSPGSPYRIDVHDTDGQLIRSIRRDHTPRPVEPALIERYSSERRGSMEAGSGEAAMLEARLALPHAEQIPALGRLVVSADGVLWAERPDLAEDPVRLEFRRGEPQDVNWDVHDEAGRLRGTARTPADFHVHAVTTNAAIGVLRDSLGVEHVVRFRLVTD
jgi:hypothetical protein